MKGRFEDPKIQKYVQEMNNWQRNQWQRAGYPTNTRTLAKFLKMKRKETK